MTEWPHINSEIVVEQTVAWIAEHKTWPKFLQHPEAVAAQIVRSGRYTWDQLRDFGYRKRSARP